eukprot:3186943-Pyramimonas_sp.AAC.1
MRAGLGNATQWRASAPVPITTRVETQRTMQGALRLIETRLPRTKKHDGSCTCTLKCCAFVLWPVRRPTLDMRCWSSAPPAEQAVALLKTTIWKLSFAGSVRLQLA